MKINDPTKEVDNMKLSQKAKQSLDRVSKMFKEDNLPEKISQTVISGEGKPSDSWSLLNRAIMLAHGTTDARGYRQWQRVNRQVKEGSQAIYIIGPTIITEEVEEEKENGETEVVETKKLVGFHTIPVFKYEDTKGEELPDYTPKDLPPLSKVVEKLDYKLEYNPYSGARGWIDPANKEIHLSTEDARSFYHELGHALHEEISEHGLLGGQHSNQEIIAESVSAVLCHLYGFEGFLPHSRDYINAYSEDGNPYQAVMEYFSDVEKVLNYLFNELVESHKGSERCEDGSN